MSKDMQEIYGDSSKNITFSLLNKKKLAKCYAENNI
jgi:hypothetical protein